MNSTSTLYRPVPTPFNIRYVALSGEVSSVRRHRIAVAVRRVAIAVVAAATIIVAGIGFSEAVNAANPARTDPVRGEYRLAPGNQQPPGYVIPLDRGLGLSSPATSAFRLVGPKNVTPPGIVPKV